MSLSEGYTSVNILTYLYLEEFFESTQMTKITRLDIFTTHDFIQLVLLKMFIKVTTCLIEKQ